MEYDILDNEIDFSKAKTIKELPENVQKTLARVRENHYAKMGLSLDVADWLAKQDENTREHVNGMIRHMIAVQAHKETL